MSALVRIFIRMAPRPLGGAFAVNNSIKKSMSFTRYRLGCLFSAIPVTAFAADATKTAGVQQSAQDAGVSAIWILANISYAGMRAQNQPRAGWRVLAFIFGFPGTLLTYFVVPEGGERAYGIDIPKKR